MKNLIKHIPNILTLIRGIISIPIVIAGLSCNYLILALLVILGGLTDLFDGIIARKYKTTNDPKVILNGANLDAVIDKIFVISTAIALSPISILSISFIPFELIIGIINIKFSNLNNSKIKFMDKLKYNLLNKYNDNSLKKPKSSIIGKIKTASIILSLVSIACLTKIPSLLLLTQLSSGITILLQTIAIGDYLNKYNKNKKSTIINNYDKSYTADKKNKKQNEDKIKQLEQLYQLKNIYNEDISHKYNKQLIKK